MQVTPYLNFNGDCGEAFDFYAKTLGGKIAAITTHGESPIASEVPPDWHDLVLHAPLEAGDLVLMASDAPPDRYQKPQGLYVALQIDDVAEAERVFGALSRDGQVIMPFEQTFWAARFGMAIDRFGTPWMVSCDQAE